jgi:hypothetical protein
MLHDGGETHRQRLRQLADRSRPPRQPLDDRPPRWIGKGVESEVERGLLVKHMLLYRDEIIKARTLVTTIARKINGEPAAKDDPKGRAPEALRWSFLRLACFRRRLRLRRTGEPGGAALARAQNGA